MYFALSVNVLDFLGALKMWDQQSASIVATKNTAKWREIVGKANRHQTNISRVIFKPLFSGASRRLEPVIKLGTTSSPIFTRDYFMSENLRVDILF